MSITHRDNHAIAPKRVPADLLISNTADDFRLRHADQLIGVVPLA